MPRPPNPEVRSRLIEKGAEIIHRLGFNGCGVQDITAAAGVPKGSFYNYFESNDAFAAAILDEYWRAIESNYVSILEDDFVSPLKRVERHFSELIEYHERQKFTFGCLIGNLALELAAQSSIARSKLKALLRTWTAALAKCLSAASEAGELPLAREPQDLAATLIEAFEGAVMVAKVEQSGRALRRFGTVALPRLLA